ncbi:MAG: hypothetical protein WC505_06020 [Patescibacteria group bacterium]
MSAELPSNLELRNKEAAELAISRKDITMATPQDEVVEILRCRAKQVNSDTFLNLGEDETNAFLLSPGKLEYVYRVERFDGVVEQYLDYHASRAWCNDGLRYDGPIYGNLISEDEHLRTLHVFHYLLMSMVEIARKSEFYHNERCLHAHRNTRMKLTTRLNGSSATVTPSNSHYTVTLHKRLDNC